MLVGLLPFFHIYGQTVVVNLGLSQGATIVTMPRFDMGAFLDLLEQPPGDARAHRAARGAGAREGARRRGPRPLALRVVISGAAPLGRRHRVTARRSGSARRCARATG